VAVAAPGGRDRDRSVRDEASLHGKVGLSDEERSSFAPADFAGMIDAGMTSISC